MPKEKTTSKENKASVAGRLVKKSAVKAVSAKGAETKSKQTSKSGSRVNLRVDVIGTNGSKLSQIVLPEKIFGQKENKSLIAQSLRVFLASRRKGTASTKTRGEVHGSTRKIYRQKGTGRARHGGIRAPIFVGGGIVFGPKPRDFTLKLSKKMRQRGLFSALSAKLQKGSVLVVSGMQDLKPKTKEFAICFRNISSYPSKGSVLFIVANAADTVVQAARNLKDISIVRPSSLSIYDVTKNKTLVLMKEAVDDLEKHYFTKEK